MDLNKITKILIDSGIHVCPICGTPYSPYHSRQKTCGSKECKKTFHNQYVQNRVKRLKEEDLDAWREYHAKANRKWREKQKNKDKREEDLKELQERWEKQSTLDKKIAEYGHEYGKRSAEKVLANVPKIDVSMGGHHDRDKSDD